MINAQKQKRSLSIGQRFGRLIVVGCFTRDGEAWCRCACDCGNKKVARRTNVRRGAVKSCGCIHPRHGDAAGKKTPEYIAWRGMIARCTRRQEPGFHRYGGRGITVCDEWRQSYPRFLADMGRKPTPRHSIDRVNNDGNYEPSNCRWATRTEQNRNRRNNRILDGVPLVQAAEACRLNCSTLRSRIDRGMTSEQAMTAPLGRMGVTVGGETASVDEWAARSGVNRWTIYKRIGRGWSPERAVAAS